ncbi:MAG: excinuclease ABC subunit UvrC [Bifidobacterium tibiigranuli]|jgi:excinuclease ABC subunit C|uniref:excinuclease ABC subunit UvrC n=1 Tax=Bifidobacterium tibiigranuli TaxID=2172043 RepID=UPI0023550174|nr:excinuclease ABC subunit UvrC [Bifidobacterium tibiigranuli]MCH3974554.1 excinuclease ABC subunit UvrC [Bifidobacterium tibiigranuli]MCH4189472.1 excinuclease ABC subunit UvrC [Bifidobacterium tibiigranuli]MCH4204295.1 excinuclease ABC subunit UvrC [Bifidobacterium tibiigranuli]MCH4275342.1 excinuclease ABC subunit UvrC [Bifidobacterium tibiigranuli]MCI1791547.1 excinuclease ABC subunit UvrC [Bifidobacterium tibiigranuli]
MTGIIERHSPDEWRRTASTTVKRLGDSRDLFRPKTGDIPAEPGVYKWRDGEGRVIYVGKAKNLRNRLTNYFQPLNQLHPRTQTMVLTARSLEWTVVGTELEALTLEYTWIKEFDPRFNVVFRDDKTYPYLAVSVGEDVPRVWVTRNRKRKDTRYFGPYAKVWDLRHSLDKLLKTFPVRTCSPAVFHRAQMTGRPCLLASIGKCSAPCVGRIGLDEHRRDCERLVGVLTGRFGKSYISSLTREMKQASADMEFERAARLRDQIQMLQTVGEQNAVVFSQDVDADVFGLESDELEASVHAFFVRSGSIRGERNWSVERVEDVSDTELISDLIVQVYSDIATADSAETQHEAQYESEHEAREISSFDTSGEAEGSSTTEGGIDAPDAAQPSHASVHIRAKRNALGSTQTVTATDALSRAQATRERRERQEQTGRADLLAPIAPIPREIIVPIEPARRAELETWLSQLRGSAVTIHVPARGEKKALMERANDNAKQALQRSKLSRISDMGARTQAMNDVAKALGLKQAPLRIEGYDISNTIGGIFQVASMVVFEDAIAKKSEYRRFAIRGDDGKGALDDLSAVYETLTRRFKHGNIAGDSGEDLESEQRIRKATEHGLAEGADAKEENASDSNVAEIVAVSAAFAVDAPANTAAATDAATADEPIVQQNAERHHFAYKPNLIVVDGGKPQVMAAAKALRDSGVDDVAVCGLAKRLEEVWVPDDDYPIILKRQSEGMYLLQRVRDESHRFAITYHRQTRRKGALRSALDDIPGVGEAYQKRLLNAFGSVRAMRQASLEDLMAVKGIGKAKAETIYNALHKDGS